MKFFILYFRISLRHLFQVNMPSNTVKNIQIKRNDKSKIKDWVKQIKRLITANRIYFLQLENDIRHFVFRLMRQNYHERLQVIIIQNKCKHLVQTHSNMITFDMHSTFVDGFIQIEQSFSFKSNNLIMFRFFCSHLHSSNLMFATQKCVDNSKVELVNKQGIWISWISSSIETEMKE